MKYFVAFLLLLGGAYYFYPDFFQGLIGIGGAKYGISKEDPLGKPEKIDKVLSGWGFTATKPGVPGKPRVVEYSDNDKEYPDFKGTVQISVGEEEYIQSITAVFVGTQHGYSPARPTKGELFGGVMWKATGGGKPKFEKVSDGKTKFPLGITIAESHMEANFSAGEVIGTWAYSDRSPMEVIVLKLK